MAEKDIHYYEPANGHGLKHDPFNAIVAPRPIGWISSRDAKGNINLAPYSFFNAFCYKPPIVGFSSTSWKDSVSNIQETKEFCWNLSIMDLAKQMNATSAHVAHDVNEFTIAGLTATPSKIVRVPRVAESPVSFANVPAVLTARVYGPLRELRYTSYPVAALTVDQPSATCEELVAVAEKADGAPKSVMSTRRCTLGMALVTIVTR